MPIETSVSIVAAPCRALTTAARWNGHAPHTHDRRGEQQRAHSQGPNLSCGTIHSSTGAARMTEISSRRRSSASP